MFSFFVIAHASASSTIRIIDTTGSESNEGLLQVQTEFGLGTVCGLTQTAAKVACKQLGFLDGVASTTPCSAYGGSNVCGASGSAVAMKALKCTGVEAMVQECAWP